MNTLVFLTVKRQDMHSSPLYTVQKKSLLFSILLFFASTIPAADITNDLDRLFNSLAANHSRGAQMVVAVLPFSCAVADCEQQAGRTIAEYAVSFFSNQGTYRLVERMEFQKVAEEIALSQTGILSKERTLEAGRMLGATIIVTGSIGDALGKKMISARMIATETGEVVSSSSVSVETRLLDSFYKDMLSERTQLSASLFRSLLAPGWGQFYTNHSGQGALFSVSALASAGVLVWSLVDWNNKSNTVAANRTKLLSNDPDQDMRLRTEAFDANKAASGRSAVVGGITGGVWALNLLNAAILGAKDKGRVQDLYFSFTGSEYGIIAVFTF
jgi:TolB-like protein